jgi:YbgC/YbaW family acyl-CoA thioester hydrolase
MKRQDFRFSQRLRVRWAEVDLQQIVFNAHYLMYVDTAIASYWRAVALPYVDAMRYLGGDIFMRKASVEFNSSAQLDDILDVRLKCARIGVSSMVFEAGIFRDDELLVQPEMTYVFADPVARTSKPVPQALRDTLMAYEAGEPMVKVATGSWSELGDAAGRLRTEVFVNEQRIPAEMEWDEADADAVHAVATNRLGQAIACGRLLKAGPGVARIGRMAVRRMLRGSGIGRQVLDRLVEEARLRGDHEVVLHAQRSAEAFYRGLGFAPRGLEFEEAGIPHIEMVRGLR